MSDVATRIPLVEAETLANEVVAMLAPGCDRIEIAGSIRRRRADIGDLEIICIPSVVARQVDLFGHVTETFNLLDERAAGLIADGVFSHRLDKNGHAAFGERYKRLTYKGIGLDLFSVLSPAQWGVLWIIRTGSADFSHRLVTQKALGGWLPNGLHVINGAIWRNGEIVPTPEEEQVFELLGRPWVAPEARQ